MTTLLLPRADTSWKPSRSNIATVPNQIPTARGWIRGVPFDRPSARVPNRLKGRTEGDPSDAAPPELVIDEETSDPPERAVLPRQMDRAIDSLRINPRQLLAETVLAPADGHARRIDEDPVGSSLTYELPLVLPVPTSPALPCEIALVERTRTVVEHAPASGLHATVLREQALEIRPRRGGETLRHEPRRGSLQGHSPRFRGLDALPGHEPSRSTGPRGPRPA